MLLYPNNCLFYNPKHILGGKYETRSIFELNTIENSIKSPQLWKQIVSNKKSWNTGHELKNCYNSFQINIHKTVSVIFWLFTFYSFWFIFSWCLHMTSLGRQYLPQGQGVRFTLLHCTVHFLTDILVRHDKQHWIKDVCCIYHTLISSHKVTQTYTQTCSTNKGFVGQIWSSGDTKHVTHTGGGQNWRKQ